MTTVTAFTPTSTQNFSFQPTLDGQQYTATVTWGLFGQRWILNIYTLQNALVMSKPMTPSPTDYDVNLIEGYFSTSTLVFRAASNSFEINT